MHSAPHKCWRAHLGGGVCLGELDVQSINLAILHGHTIDSAAPCCLHLASDTLSEACNLVSGGLSVHLLTSRYVQVSQCCSPWRSLTSTLLPNATYQQQRHMQGCFKFSFTMLFDNLSDDFALFSEKEHQFQGQLKRKLTAFVI